MGRGDDADDMENWFYEVKWQHKPRPEQRVVHRAADFIPSAHEIAQAVAREVHQLDGEFGWTKMFSRAEEPFDILSAAYIVQALHDLGWQWKLGERITVDALMEQLNLAPRHRQLMRRFMQILEKVGYCQKRWRGCMGGRPPACPAGPAKTLATYTVAISCLDCRAEPDRQMWIAPRGYTCGARSSLCTCFSQKGLPRQPSTFTRIRPVFALTTLRSRRPLVAL